MDFLFLLLTIVFIFWAFIVVGEESSGQNESNIKEDNDNIEELKTNYSDFFEYDGFYSGTGFGDSTMFKHELVKKYGDYCQECGQTGIPLQVDHIVPISKGGADDLSNMQLLCYDCHMKKHNYSFKETGGSPRKVPEKYKLIVWAFKNQQKIEIRYKKYDGTISKRVIKPITNVYYEKTGRHGGYYVRAYCYLRNEERIFKISRIMNIKKYKDG